LISKVYSGGEGGFLRSISYFQKGIISITDLPLGRHMPCS
jgi:hypothetical protein